MKKLVSLLLIFTVAVLAVSPAAFVQAETVPTSDCISDLTVRFTDNGEANGTLAVTADVTGVADTEYVTLCVFSDITDINNIQGQPLSFKTYKSTDVISEGKLTINLAIASSKLTGMCVARAQIPNRGEGNDWVGAWIEVPVTLKANYAEVSDETVYAPCGASADEWISANVGNVFSRKNWIIGGWGKDEDRTAIGSDVITAAGYTAYAIWKYRGLCGDMDQDETVTVTDALSALRIAAKLSGATYDDMQIGDMDGDKELTVTDALSILRVAAKLAEPEYLG